MIHFGLKSVTIVCHFYSSGEVTKNYRDRFQTEICHDGPVTMNTSPLMLYEQPASALKQRKQKVKGTKGTTSGGKTSSSNTKGSSSKKQKAGRGLQRTQECLSAMRRVKETVREIFTCSLPYALLNACRTYQGGDTIFETDADSKGNFYLVLDGLIVLFHPGKQASPSPSEEGQGQRGGEDDDDEEESPSPSALKKKRSNMQQKSSEATEEEDEHAEFRRGMQLLHVPHYNSEEFLLNLHARKKYKYVKMNETAGAEEALSKCTYFTDGVAARDTNVLKMNFSLLDRLFRKSSGSCIAFMGQRLKNTRPKLINPLSRHLTNRSNSSEFIAFQTDTTNYDLRDAAAKTKEKKRNVSSRTKSSSSELDKIVSCVYRNGIPERKQTNLKSIALIPTHSAIRGKLALQIQTSLAKCNKVHMFSQMDDIALKRTSLHTVHCTGPVLASNIAHWEDGHQLLYVADTTVTEWTKLCLRQADIVVCALHCDDEAPFPHYAQYPAEHYVLRHVKPHQSLEFLLLHGSLPHHGLHSGVPPSGTCSAGDAGSLSERNPGSPTSPSNIDGHGHATSHGHAASFFEKDLRENRTDNITVPGA